MSSDLAARYRAIRASTVALCEPLCAEDCQVQSMPDASPVKWHLAHTSWFFETFVLELEIDGYAPFHPQYRVLFNSYYQSVGAQHPRPTRGQLSRPTLEEVLGYRAHVDRHTGWLLERVDARQPVASVIELGLHHEQQHQELILTDVKHLFSCNPLRPAYRSRGHVPPEAVLPLHWITFTGGLCEVGHGGDGFAFDNETPRHRVHIEPFALASRLVTNGEFLQFIEDRGYHRPELWLSDGWEAVRALGWEAPLYWERAERNWKLFSLAGMREIEPSEPVCHVSYYEADAFARWAGARLPRETEWELAAASGEVSGNFVESGWLHPTPLRSGAPVEQPLQLFGDAWEWTQSPYMAYPRYRPPSGALGEYNGKFMSNQMVLRGGSCASPASHLRATYRNFFPPPARWQFSGVRLAQDR
jgi:ergothioneine biosynthesis protein EgtB